MNINFTQKQGKLFPKIPLSHLWKATAFIAITIAVAEGYWIYQAHSHSSVKVSSPKATSQNENVQFVGGFSQRISQNYPTTDSLKIENQPFVTQKDSIWDSNLSPLLEVNAEKPNSPYLLQYHQTEQTKEQLLAWLKQNMALVNDIRKVMYRIEFAKQKNKQLQDSMQIVHSSLNIIEDSVVLWKVRAVSFETEVADNQSKRAINALQKQEMEWQKELATAKTRSEHWQSILHQYNERLNFYKGK
jgi:hypothetical protein